MLYFEATPETLPPCVLNVEAAPHPRLFATAEEFEVLRRKTAAEGIHKRMLERLVFLADGILGVPPAERVVQGRRLLGVSRLEVYRISTLALCYRMTGNPAYRDRCVEELRAIARFQDWNPSHFLDVAEMTLAVATGYDWLYGDLSPEDRDLLADAIREKGLLSSGPDAWWHRAANNWGQVCHTGMMAGAIAIAERDPALFRRQMAESIRNIAIPMAHYAPGGNYPEGPGYWGYGTGYNVIGLSILETACGEDFGLSALPGFAASGHYPALVEGPSGLSFNYADCGGGASGNRRKKVKQSNGTPWWFARHFHDPSYVEPRERQITERWCALRAPVAPEANNGWIQGYQFFWIDDPVETPPVDLPLVWNPGGPVPIVVARTSWDADAVFLGVKAGPPKWSHGHLDGGSFVLDAFGTRWFDDLGAEDYHRLEQMGVGLWDWKQDSDRWRLFRLGSRSHNTLTIDDRLQRVAGCAKVLRVETAGDATEIELDLSSLYADACSKALRRMTLRKSGELLVEDRLEGLREGALVSWRGCTFREVLEIGGETVVLGSGDARMEIRNESASGRWEVVDASQDPPAFRGDSPNPGLHQLRLELSAPADGRLALRVRITPRRD